MTITSLIVKGYSIINHSGVLDSAWGRRQFAKAYFFGKQHLDPVYANLTRHYPELFRGGPIFDVGANIGYMASLFAKAADPQFKVYAFEPEPANFEMLKENVKSGKYHNRIVPIQAAVGEQDDLAELWCNSICQGDRRVITPEFKAALSAEAADLVEVPIVSLDSFIDRQQIQTPPSFVKMRVQGYEIPVCNGMRNILDNSPKLTVAMTYAPDYIKALGYEPTQLLDIFEDRGFHFHAVNNRGKIRALANPKPEIAELLVTSNSFVHSQLPLPEPTVQQTDLGPQLYVELLLTRKSLLQ